MSSPFPGMDPYLETPQRWAVFQHQFIAGLSDVLQPSIGDRYRLRTGNRFYVNEQVLFTSILREEHREEYTEIRQRPSGRLISVVDLVSPSNRTTTTGRKEYLAKREEFRRQGAHVVELDLVLQGQSCLNLSLENVPEYDYLVSVSRAQHPDRFEVYTAKLQGRLPRFRLPLGSDDRDVVVDLQGIFNRCYDHHFAGKIDYKQDPPVVLNDDDRKWMQQLLKAQKLR
jgi:hypothetical protein